ncbi:amino acid adenylation domain-containing protein [Chryseobacterium sp. Chry.R1]|uniref:amino acid adenylation domain-containing protein n=1 Tax=Chryseobacterium sp. Chry.R1 TaxID=3139392 RepID=UPI0031F964C9
MSDGDRIILVIHHLVVDGVSWRILLEDLGSLYESGMKGVSYELPSKTDSFQSWGAALKKYSNSSSLSQERLYWEGIESEIYPVIPTDYPAKGKHILDSSISFSLNESSTKLLQGCAGKKYSAEINDVLLTGLALSLQDQFGINKTKVLMEGHGREVMSTGLDISRTVGWFTSVYPFSLDINNKNQPALVSIKENLRGIPHKGIGYGVLNYLGDSFSSTGSPTIQFNYLGDFDDTIGSAFNYSSESIGNPVSEENLGTDILLDVSGITISGAMTIKIRYSGDLFTEATVQKLMDSYQNHLEKMIGESECSEVILTPSDLTYKGLSFNTIQEINKKGDIEDIYELSPMQQGLYYHWLVEPKGATYFMQTSYRTKSEGLDLSEVEKAFGILVNRYTVLRTSFDNRYGEVPLQIVHKKAQVDFKHLILESELELDTIKEEDIAQGFDLGVPTQMRLTVITLPNGEYEFIWSHHHIIMDGWCLSILINDFAVILNSLKQDVEINLPESKKYSSYINWLKTVNKEEALSYWGNYLKGVVSPTLIPFKKSTSEKDPHFITEIIKVENEEFAGISNLCKNLGITLNTYVQGVWSYLLSCYNASEEVVFGSVVSGRPANIEEVEHIVGLFINTIPVCVNVSKDETPRNLLEKLHYDSIQGTGYHFTGLSDIQSLSSLGKELINNIIVFENYAKRDVDNHLSIMGMADQKADTFEQTNYDFNIIAVPGKNSLSIDFKYNSSVFYKSLITSLAGHFKNILGQFAAFPDQAIKNFSYLSNPEVKELLEDFNGAETSYSSEKTVVKLFEEQVNSCANSVALTYDDVKLSYNDLNTESNRLAHYLRNHYNIRSNDLVCIELPRNEKMIVSILGILKSGGAYVPIDVNYPQERTEYIIKDTKCKLYIDESFWKEFDSLKENYSIENLSTEIHPSDLAYVIYTSGTTGNPKGVCISHSSLMNYISWSNGYYFNCGDRGNWGLFTSISFDLSVTALFCSLTRGCSLWLGENEADILAVLMNAFENPDIDILKLTPSHISLLKNVEINNTGIRKIILGGEKLYNEHIQIIHTINKDIEIYDEYGPTEATVGCIARKVELSVNTIGGPISNTQIYILDEYGHLLPVGVHGELYIAGAGLARGYLNREDLTEEKFIDNPFVEGTKMYRTGDLGRWLPDGTIEYLGRIDDQVKIRGHRIELGEIDHQVLSFSESIKSVVTEVKEHEGDKKLVVYYVSNSVIDKQELAYYLESKLPNICYLVFTLS